MNLISAGVIDMKSMISHKMGMSSFREAFDLVRGKKGDKNYIISRGINRRMRRHEV